VDLKIDALSRNNTASVIIGDSGEVRLAAAFSSMILLQRFHTRTVVGGSFAGSGAETDLPAY
jgi:hypothetical protein